jgi:hypothetical protein
MDFTQQSIWGESVTACAAHMFQCLQKQKQRIYETKLRGFREWTRTENGEYF